ncbi:MFS transporter [Streptomyces sp. NPDC002308]
MTANASTPATGPGPTGHPQRWLILGVICLAQLTVLLDNTVLNVAIPSLTEELGASGAEVQWMINAYSLVQSGLLLTAGSASDRYGRKKLLLVGLTVFGLGSLAAGLAETPGQLVAARAEMGVGAAFLLTSTLAVVVQVFDATERVRAIGLWATVNSLGFAAGPLLGGVLLGHFRWGAIFLVNLPVAALALVAVALLVPEFKNPGSERPDLVGALLSTLGMSALVYAIISGPEHGWSSFRVLLTAFAGTAVLAGFALWELRVPYPMLDPRFFRSRSFTGAVAGAVLVAFGMGGSLFLLTQHLQFVLGYGPLEAGLRTAPLALTVVALNLTGFGARLVPRLGTPATIAAGMSLLAAGLAAVALLAGRGYDGMLLGLVVMGVGIALAAPAMAAAIMGAIPPERAGVGAGVNGTLAEFGNGLGVAVLGAVLTSRFTALLPLAAAGAASLPAALAAVGEGPERAAVTDAFAAGLERGQLAGAAAVLAGGLVAALLLRRAERTPRPSVGTRESAPEGEANTAEEPSGSAA